MTGPVRGSRRAGARPHGGRVAVTPARPPEIGELAALMGASPLLRRYGTTAGSARAALRRGRAAGDRVLVVRRPGGPALGLAWVMASRILTRAAYLRLLLVAEDAQDAGLGSRLLAAAERDARRRANHLLLLVTRDNAGARRFYARRGYRRVGSLPGLAVPGLDEVLYWKPLRDRAARLPV